MARRTAEAAAGCLLASLLAVLSTTTPAQADPVLTVPAAPSGDVVVTAEADPAAWPYLQVKLALPANLHAPYESMTAIDPAPVANGGGPVEIIVPTWGLTDRTATFVLLGCATSAPDSCATLLASADRPLTQTEAATASIQKPDGVLLTPEESVQVTADNEGGGELRAYLQDGLNWREDDLVNHAATTFDGYVEDSASGTLSARRCSALVELPTYCEVLASEQLAYVGTAPPVVTTPSGCSPSTPTGPPRRRSSRSRRTPTACRTTCRGRSATATTWCPAR
jgi:hypothetical protein